jgi:hypothetical protein
LLVALKRLKLILPDRDDTYFDTLALVGEVSIRQRKPAWWAHKDCDEFLSNLIVGLDELITWLDTPGSSDAGPSDWTPAYPWTTLWLIGEELPDIYSETFARKYGLSEKGPGPRFVKTLLRLAKAKKLVDQNFTDLTIMGYRRRALKLGKGAFAWPAPSAR